MVISLTFIWATTYIYYWTGAIYYHNKTSTHNVIAFLLKFKYVLFTLMLSLKHPPVKYLNTDWLLYTCLSWCCWHLSDLWGQDVGVMLCSGMWPCTVGMVLERLAIHTTDTSCPPAPAARLHCHTYRYTLLLMVSIMPNLFHYKWHSLILCYISVTSI